MDNFLISPKGHYLYLLIVLLLLYNCCRKFCFNSHERLFFSQCFFFIYFLAPSAQSTPPPPSVKAGGERQQAMSEKYMSIGAPMTELPIAQSRAHTSLSHRSATIYFDSSAVYQLAVSWSCLKFLYSVYASLRFCTLKGIVSQHSRDEYFLNGYYHYSITLNRYFLYMRWWF